MSPSWIGNVEADWQFRDWRSRGRKRKQRNSPPVRTPLRSGSCCVFCSCSKMIEHQIASRLQCVYVLIKTTDVNELSQSQSSFWLIKIWCCSWGMMHTSRKNTLRKNFDYKLKKKNCVFIRKVNGCMWGNMTQQAEYHQPKEKVSDWIRCKNSMWRFLGKLLDSFDRVTLLLGTSLYHGTLDVVINKIQFQEGDTEGNSKAA